MRIVPETIEDGWASPIKIGANAWVTRVTVQRMNVSFLNYSLAVMGSKTLQGSGQFSSMVFGQRAIPVELGNFRNVEIDRDIDNLTASCNITIINNTAGDALKSVDTAGAFGKPGFLSPERGFTGNPWGHAKNEFSEMLVPDRLIHVFGGYGVDRSVPPELDEHMVKIGTFLIDRVEINADQNLVLRCRDLFRALQDAVVFPDVVPLAHYPLRFETYRTVPGDPIVNTKTTASWVRPSYDTDSNKVYIGRGFTDGKNRPYVDSKGTVNGRAGKNAFDRSEDSYWLSVGSKSPTWTSAYEWAQGSIKTGSVSAVKVRAYGGPYTVYVSLQDANGNWLGTSKIPYKSRAVNAGTAIPFVHKFKIDKGKLKTVALPKVYGNVKKVRITLGNLWDSGIGEFRYRGGLRDVQVQLSTSVTTTTPTTAREGNVDTITDIVRWPLAWGGFLWPQPTTGYNFLTLTDGSQLFIVPDPIRDKNLPHSRIWGDLTEFNVQLATDIPEDTFDRQPLVSILEYVKELTGCDMFCDETGAAVMRMPNIFQQGNYLSGPLGGPNEGRTVNYVTLRDDENILSFNKALDSRNVRERIFVANIAGGFGATVSGYNPYPSGLRRYGGVTSQHNRSSRDSQVTADLIALRQYQSFKDATVTIAANPQIQVGDQILIEERITATNDFWLVNSIKFTHDVGSGRAVYEMNCSWLGPVPGDLGFVGRGLSEATKQYLKKLGAI
jgi:hypothetical protein